MQLARQLFKITVPPNAIIHFTDNSPAYLVKRFDVKSDGSKYAQEDFAQIAQVIEETHGKNYKYDLSYEEIGLLIKRHIPTYAIEFERFFRLVLFNYIFSNGDAHVKNFSAMLTDEGDHVLTPAYDLLCTGYIHQVKPIWPLRFLKSDSLKLTMRMASTLMTISWNLVRCSVLKKVELSKSLKNLTAKKKVSTDWLTRHS
jgi:hypothetical protein